MNIKYEELELQPYLTSPLFNDEETKLLFDLRSRTLESCKANFENLYGEKVDCPLKCWTSGETPKEDTQQHILQCDIVKGKVAAQDIACSKVEYEHLFGNTKQQKEAVEMISRLLKAKEELINENPPGEKLDPSMGGNSCLCYSDAVF